MPVTWFPGTQSSKSESDFIFNHSKSTASCFSPLYLHFPLNPVHHLPQIKFAALSANCKRGSVWLGSPLLITSTFFLSSPLSRAALSLSEISLRYSSGEMQPCQSNYITLIARLETTIEALFPGYSTSSFPLGGPHVNVVLKESVCFEQA